MASNAHPDHDTLCAFRRNNFEAVTETFEQVLLLAKELKLFRVGTVSVDGTKVDANANKHKNVRYDRAQALREQLRAEVGELLERAESEDAQEAADPQALPEDLATVFGETSSLLDLGPALYCAAGGFGASRAVEVEAGCGVRGAGAPGENGGRGGPGGT